MTRTYKPRKPATLALNVQLEFEPNRLEQSYLQQAYALVLPMHVRRSSVAANRSTEAVLTPVTLELKSCQQAKVRGKAV